MAAEEANWLLAQNRILETLKAEKSLHNKVKTNLRRVQDEADKQRNMVEQVRSVGKYWSGLWKNRHDFAVNYWKADLKKMTANFEQKLAAQDAELRSVREEAAAQLSRSAEEKSQLMVKMAAIEAKKVEKGLMLQQLGHQFSCREREWRLRASALEDQISDLQRERSVRENHMMNEIQLLMQKYTHLQVPHLSSSFLLRKNIISSGSDLAFTVVEKTANCSVFFVLFRMSL